MTIESMKPNGRTITFIRENWQILSFVGAIILVLIKMYYGLSDVQAQAIENKADIRQLQANVADVQGDIKAIRAGIDILLNQKR